MKIGLFGGTFDPVHNGHLVLARQALQELKLDKLIWIPALPWQKSHQNISSAPLRTKLVEIAIAHESKMTIDRLEIEANHPSYSIETINFFKKCHPNDQLFYLIGADQWANFDTWKKWTDILTLCTLVVFSRNQQLLECPPCVKTFIDEHPNHVIFIDMPSVPISSSEIRHIIKTKGLNAPELEKLLPDAVLKYLKLNNLSVADD